MQFVKRVVRAYMRQNLRHVYRHGGWLSMSGGWSRGGLRGMVKTIKEILFSEKMKEIGTEN